MPQKTPIDQMMAHQSIRKFTHQTVSQEIINTCIKAGQAAASSSFVQVTSVIQVNCAQNRAALAIAAGGQSYVESAAVFLVFCADLQRNQEICLRQHQQMPTGYTEQTLIASVDTALFAQNVLLAAQSLGLGGVFIGGLRNQPEVVTKVLKLPKQVFPIFGLCLGYPDQDPGQKPRLPLSMVLHQEHYSNDNLTHLANYDTQIRHYYQKRSQGRLNLTFSEHIVKTLVKEARPHMLPYLHSQGFCTR
ncbi:MAG: oxygen-insensitive NADPH nitroreductase [Oceanospirillaceae bacterium]|nr:oxygen-insensitive NADPH nitroreductase [Oceanospirillaceae bacterium]